MVMASRTKPPCIGTTSAGYVARSVWSFVLQAASERGTIQRVSPDRSKLATVCTSVRFPVSMDWSDEGQLITSEQECTQGALPARTVDAKVVATGNYNDKNHTNALVSYSITDRLLGIYQPTPRSLLTSCEARMERRREEDVATKN